MKNPDLTLLTTPSRGATSATHAALDAVRAGVRRWAVESHQGARRNAMVACTALARVRAEREDVEDFFAEREGRSAAAADVPQPRAGEPTSPAPAPALSPTLPPAATTATAQGSARASAHG